MKVATLSEHDYSAIIYDHFLSFLVEIQLTNFDKQRLILLLRDTEIKSKTEDQLIKMAIKVVKES